jgi:uncharacterized protein
MRVNQLATETSPYLLQHKHNPVDWQPWSESAFAEAKRRDIPVLLSIGYAACHWCHVMAHESFENDAIAEVMNAHFVNLKVDREERPDIDTIYMSALHELGEQGGWPLTMFLTPDREPFWGGTYFPPESRYGRPGFRHVLLEISRIWREERHKATANSAALLTALKRPASQAGESKLSLDIVKQAAAAIANAVDPVHGGLRGAPKFPQAPIFNFLWAAGHRAPVLKTLERISLGGIYDHLGGGIARYSVDATWLVPHFEKMLYDNAQYVSLLSRAWLATGNGLFHQCTEETVGFLLRDMVTAGGAFASSYDADSEGEEGRFYVWRKSEVESVLPDADAFCMAYGVTVLHPRAMSRPDERFSNAGNGGPNPALTTRSWPTGMASPSWRLPRQPSPLAAPTGKLLRLRHLTVSLSSSRTLTASATAIATAKPSTQPRRKVTPISSQQPWRSSASQTPRRCWPV